MYKHAEATTFDFEKKIGLIKTLLNRLSSIQQLIQRNQFGKENLDAACELLGITLSEFNHCSEDEKDTILLQVKRDAWLLFHPDKYASLTEIEDNVRALFHLIEPAIAMVQDFLLYPAKYHFASEELPETYLVRPPRDMSLIQFPDFQRVHDDNLPEYWAKLIKFKKPIMLKKDKSTLVQQYQHLFSEMAMQNNTETSTISPADLFYELFREGAINFSHEGDEMLTVLSSLPSEIAKKIVHSNRFLRAHGSRFDYLMKFLQLFKPISTHLDVIFYALEHFPEHVTHSLIQRYIANQYGHESQPHRVSHEQYQKSAKSLVAALRERGLLRAVMGDGLAYLMKNNESFANEVFDDLEWLLQLRDCNMLYYEWASWEATMMDRLKACGVKDPSHQELLMAVMHINSSELDIFDSKQIQSVYETYQARLPKWVGQRVQYTQRLADKLTHTANLELSVNVKNDYSDAHLAALNRFCEPYAFKYNIRGNKKSIDILQPQLRAWLEEVTQGKDYESWRNSFKVELDKQCEKYIRGENTEYDLVTLQKLYEAIGHKNAFRCLLDDFVSEVSKRCDQQLLSAHLEVDHKDIMKTLRQQLQHVDRLSQFDEFSTAWRMTLRAVCLVMLYPDDRMDLDEFQVDEQSIYMIELGIKPYYIGRREHHDNMSENYKKRTRQLKDLQSVFNVCRNLGGATEFIDLTQRLLPGLAQLLHGEEITSWATISKALDKLFIRRIRCLQDKNPLQLSFYNGKNTLFDSAKIIMTTILATHPELANQSKSDPVQFIDSFLQSNLHLEEASASRLTY